MPDQLDLSWSRQSCPQRSSAGAAAAQSLDLSGPHPQGSGVFRSCPVCVTCKQ